MRTCPYCGREIPEGASVCRWCRSDLAAATPGQAVVLKSKMAANQASAVASLRTLNTSEITYASTYDVGFSSSLAQLGPPASGNAISTAAGFIDSVLADGTKSGYSFTYRAGAADSTGRTNSDTVIAVPVSPGQTGQNYYFTDESNVIRQNTQSTANASDSPIGG